MANKMKSSDMPEPQVVVYGTCFQVTQLLINDLKISLAEIAYVDAKKIFDIITLNNGILPIASVNALIRAVGKLPFKYVSQIMSNFQTKEMFEKYFIELKDKKD